MQHFPLAGKLLHNVRCTAKLRAESVYLPGLGLDKTCAVGMGAGIGIV